jgi:Tol biopolymer transport system component
VTAITRRTLLALIPSAGCALAGIETAIGSPFPRNPRPRLFFTSQGKTAVINADGTGLQYFDFKIKDQVTWQPGPFFSDGKRVVFLSMEQRRDGPGKPFEEYYTQTPTHLWVYDLDKKDLKEIATRDRLADFYTPALLMSDERILVQVVRNKVGQIFNMNLDGSDAREFTRAGEGLPYGLSLSPDGKRVAYHLASPRGYEVYTSDLEGGNRVKIAGHPDHLYFGTAWSPDGKWILYQDCRYKQDPGHDWSDVCIGRADGSEHRVLTMGQFMWFAATYGSPTTKGGGSNLPAWTKDGSILFPCRRPGAVVPWRYQTGRADTDHFNREFLPDLAKGGTQICRLDPRNGAITPLTTSDPPVWDFRASQSSDGKQIVFCRAATGGSPAIWVMDSDGRNQKQITHGLNDAGADHPRWLS